MPNLRMAIIEDAPQSTRKAPIRSRTWKQVLKRPPLPKASPDPRNCTSIASLRPPRPEPRAQSSCHTGRWPAAGIILPLPVGDRLDSEDFNRGLAGAAVGLVPLSGY